jgi:hypothetical protein
VLSCRARITQPSEVRSWGMYIVLYLVHKRMLEIELDLSDEAFPFIVDFTKQFIGKIANTLVALAPKR